MTKLARKRRKAIRAQRTLVRRYGYDECNFSPADDADYDVLPGTPMHWVTYFEGDSDCRPADEELSSVVWASETDWRKVHDEEQKRSRYAKYVMLAKEGRSTNELFECPF